LKKAQGRGWWRNDFRPAVAPGSGRADVEVGAEVERGIVDHLTATADFGGPRVLIVDSDVERRASLSALISSWGYGVAGAYDAYAGMRQVLLQRPDLIIVDADLRGWSSSAMIDGAARLGSRAPVVMLGRGRPEGLPPQGSRRRIAGVIDGPGSGDDLRLILADAVRRTTAH